MWSIDPNTVDPETGKPFEWQLTASCPYCGDESFPKSIRGSFGRNAFSVKDPTDDANYRFKTFIDEEEINGSQVRFIVKKAG